jgi:hypothetical protein
MDGIFHRDVWRIRKDGKSKAREAKFADFLGQN